MSDLNLKPCPFCGGIAKMRIRRPMTVIYCKNCDAAISYCDYYEEGDSKDKAIEAWNRRAKNEAD